MEEIEREMGRQPCCDKVGLKKGPWTAEEDKKLISFILANGQCCWRAVPKLAGLPLIPPNSVTTVRFSNKRERRDHLIMQ